MIKLIGRDGCDYNSRLCGAAYFIQGVLASKDSNETYIGEKTGEIFTSLKTV